MILKSTCKVEYCGFCSHKSPSVATNAINTPKTPIIFPDRASLGSDNEPIDAILATAAPTPATYQ
jgi:hypothetical protein